MGAAVRPDNTPSGAMQRRTKAALELFRQDKSFLVLVTGGIGRHGDAEAIVMQEILLKAGVPQEQIVLETESNDTLSSVINCARILQNRIPESTAYICSDIYHQPRCVALFRMLGITCRAAPIESGRAANGWGTWLYYYVREAVALPYDLIVLSFQRVFN